MLDINEIIDDTFQDKNVSELVAGDYYLFAVVNEVIYFYKDFEVFGSSLREDESRVITFKYKEGNLRDLAKYLEDGL